MDLEAVSIPLSELKDKAWTDQKMQLIIGVCEYVEAARNTETRVRGGCETLNLG